jgi:hypothetical protein
MNPRVLAIAILLVVAVAVTVSLLVLDRDDGGTEADQAPVNVAFDVLDAECGYANVVTAQGSIPPQQGEFCLVRVTITNQGGGAARLDPSCQFLVSATGQRYAPRPDVLEVDEASNQAFRAPVGPGQVVEDAGLYYDVPAGTKAGAAEFHTACEGELIRVDL